MTFSLLTSEDFWLQKFSLIGKERSYCRLQEEPAQTNSYPLVADILGRGVGCKLPMLTFSSLSSEDF